MKKTENLQSPKNTRLIDNSANAINLPLSSRGNSVSNTYLKEKWIRSIIQGIFLKLGYLTSDIIITKNSVNNINLIFLYYPLSQSSDSDIITGNNSKLILIKLINLIKLILQIKEPSNNYKLIAIKASNSDATSWPRFEPWTGKKEHFSICSRTPILSINCFNSIIIWWRY